MLGITYPELPSRPRAPLRPDNTGQNGDWQATASKFGLFFVKLHGKLNVSGLGFQGVARESWVHEWFFYGLYRKVVEHCSWVEFFTLAGTFSQSSCHGHVMGV